VAGSYARIPGSEAEIWGGAVDVPVIRGSLVGPAISLRGSYAEMRGLEELQLKTYGIELFLSKAFGPLTPYGALGVTRTDADATIDATPVTPERNLSAGVEKERVTVGVRLSFVIPKLAVEASRSDDWSYAAKISFGF
jgi:hypothetical protein